jgi:hypothetical protein
MQHHDAGRPDATQNQTIAYGYTLSPNAMLVTRHAVRTWLAPAPDAALTPTWAWRAGPRSPAFLEPVDTRNWQHREEVALLSREQLELIAPGPGLRPTRGGRASQPRRNPAALPSMQRPPPGCADGGQHRCDRSTAMPDQDTASAPEPAPESATRQQRRQAARSGAKRPPADATDRRRMADEATAAGMLIALYHRVYRHEPFEKAAQDIFEIVRHAQREFPGKPRALYLDIEGHRNANGGFDNDMYELQKEFVLGLLMPFLTEAHEPLAAVRQKPGVVQRDDLPDALQIQPRID